MGGLSLPILFTVIGLVLAFVTYRGIRRGGARFYTLEREALLRRATFTLFGTVIVFVGTIGLLLYERQQLVAPETTEEGEVIEGSTVATPTPEVDALPPLPTETPTPDASIPTPTPTAAICRGVVEGTFDNGLMLRDAPGGGEIQVLPEASIVTVLVEEEPVEANGFTWRFVRSIDGEEGWVADDFLTLGTGCTQP